MRTAPAVSSPSTPVTQVRTPRQPLRATSPLASRTASPLDKKTSAAEAPVETRPAPRVTKRASGKKYNLLAIGSSTGGPVALQNILTQFDRNFPLPIVLIQHMPATFTAAFAARLNTLCQIQVREAQHGDRLQPGVAYLAPGGKQVLIDNKSTGLCLKVIDSPEGINYKPSVDITFGSAAKAFPGRALGVVLTGMGADGREGCRMLKQSGSTVYTQNEKSCVIYGMPMAVDKAGYSDKSIDLELIGEHILNGVM